MSPEVPCHSCISSCLEALALYPHVFCTKVKGQWKWSKVSLIELVLTCICGSLYPQLNTCAFLKQTCHVVILVLKCVSSGMREITNSELLGCIVFWQVLKVHPDYPKIRKEILDKARASLRNWICFLYDWWTFVTSETMNEILQWQRPCQQKNTVDMMNFTISGVFLRKICNPERNCICSHSGKNTAPMCVM